MRTCFKEVNIRPTERQSFLRKLRKGQLNFDVFLRKLTKGQINFDFLRKLTKG